MEKFSKFEWENEVPMSLGMAVKKNVKSFRIIVLGIFDNNVVVKFFEKYFCTLEIWIATHCWVVISDLLLQKTCFLVVSTTFD